VSSGNGPASPGDGSPLQCEREYGGYHRLIESDLLVRKQGFASGREPNDSIARALTRKKEKKQARAKSLYSRVIEVGDETANTLRTGDGGATPLSQASMASANSCVRPPRDELAKSR